MRSFIISFSIVLTLGGCSPTVPRNELQNLPSLIEVIKFGLTDGQIRIRVSHRNNQTRVSSKLSCQLALKDQKPIKFNNLPLPDLTNYAVETIDHKIPSVALINLSKATASMAYVLDCYLFSDNFREERLIKKGTLYKIPGSDAQYR